MGIAVMGLFLITSADGTRRVYSKGILEARRKMKEFGKHSKLTPVKVTLTKDGVLEALNATPFRARAQAAASLLQVPGTPVEGNELRPDNWRELLDIRPGARLDSQIVADYPVTGLYLPDPEDRSRLQGRHPRYIYGWNQGKRWFAELRAAGRSG